MSRDHAAEAEERLVQRMMQHDREQRRVELAVALGRDLGTPWEELLKLVKLLALGAAFGD